jgi:hypothetical protein
MIRTLMAAAVITAFAFCTVTAIAADLPKTTQGMLAKLKLDESFMDGLDKELDVPQAWISGAQKEQMVRIAGS